LLEHDPEKWKPVFGKDHARTEISDDPDLKQTLGIPLLLIKTNKKPGIAAGGFAVPRVCLKQIPLRGVA
jgi:hypothetical protein